MLLPQRYLPLLPLTVTVRLALLLLLAARYSVASLPLQAPRTAQATPHSASLPDLWQTLRLSGDPRNRDDSEPATARLSLSRSLRVRKSQAVGSRSRGTPSLRLTQRLASAAASAAAGSTRVDPQRFFRHRQAGPARQPAPHWWSHFPIPEVPRGSNISTVPAGIIPSHGAVFIPHAYPDPNYKDALDKLILYFEGQRSGPLNLATLRNKWRASSGLQDGAAQGVDLTGGYYDAGDNVKFGFPMAFTVTLLSWTAIEYKSQLSFLAQLGNVQDAIKWGTDYFLKAHTAPNELWGQVGVGVDDHNCWQRPEDMSTLRTAFKINATSPGSELAGETAAALAAASLVFASSNAAYSATLLQHAKQLFAFADTYRGNYDSSIVDAFFFYPSYSGFQDELMWAALWLYRATNDSAYANYLVNATTAFGLWNMNEFSWDNKYAGATLLFSMLYMSNQLPAVVNASTAMKWKQAGEYYICSTMPGSSMTNINRSQGGLMYLPDRGDNAQYVANFVLLASLYGQYLNNNSSSSNVTCGGTTFSGDDLLLEAKRQMDYLLGSNPANMSYVIGFTKSYPQQMHHRGSSVVSYRTNSTFISCTASWTWATRNGSNPNVHYGALVGGPMGGSDFINDTRGNWPTGESATYFGIGLIAGTARMAAAPPPPPAPAPLQPPPAPSPLPSSSEPRKRIFPRVPVSVQQSFVSADSSYNTYSVTLTNWFLREVTWLMLYIPDYNGNSYSGISPQNPGYFTVSQGLPLKYSQMTTFTYTQQGAPANVTVYAWKYKFFRFKVRS